MALNHLDGTTLRNAILSGAQNIITQQDHLNKINVFPVPDGDTGSNMAAAFESIVDELLQCKPPYELPAISHRAADAALNGSRGNSGAILAQFFQGLSTGIGEHDHIGLEKFAEAVHLAASEAHDAISNPIEGTIITVMHDWAKWITENWDKMTNFQDLFEQSLFAAKTSLEHTPDQLKILAKNHVVDAGAQGFYYFVEGASNYIVTGEMPEMEKTATQEASSGSSDHVLSDKAADSLHLTAHAAHSGDLDHQYCTECIIHGDNLEIGKVKEKLKAWGSSFVIVGGKHKIKIHIHTNAPERVFRIANSFGELLETKADDMWAQYRASLNFALNKNVSLITDSSCNLPQELIVKYNIIILPCQLIVNNQTYLDRVNLSPDDFLQKLSDPSNNITTSQPSAGDVKAAFDKALRQSPVAIGIFLSDKLSGTFQTIAHTAKQYEEEELYIYDSRSATGGLGLIVLEAAKALQAGKTVPTVKNAILSNVAYTATFFACATLKHAIKGGRVSKTSGMVATCLNLLPVMKIDSSGKINKLGVGFGKKLARKKMIKAAINYAKTFRDCEMIVTHVGALDAAKAAVKQLKKKFPNKEIFIAETTPIIATHAGPGTISVSVLGKN
jgi:DegV family protein with EDD domain